MKANGQRSFTQSPSCNNTHGNDLSEVSVFCQVQNKVPALKVQACRTDFLGCPPQSSLACRAPEKLTLNVYPQAVPTGQRGGNWRLEGVLKALVEKDDVLTGKLKHTCSRATDYKCKSLLDYNLILNT